MSTNRWAQPQTMNAATALFPARVVGTLLPPTSDIPAEFKQHDGTEWNRLVSRWFFEGLNGTLVARDGIDATAATRHLSAVLRSFEPKHEHKEAGAAYLMSLWFDRFVPAADAATLPGGAP